MCYKKKFKMNPSEESTAVIDLSAWVSTTYSTHSPEPQPGPVIDNVVASPQLGAEAPQPVAGPSGLQQFVQQAGSSSVTAVYSMMRDQSEIQRQHRYQEDTKLYQLQCAVAMVSQTEKCHSV